MIIPVITGASEIATKGLKDECGVHIGKTFNMTNLEF
jgi:hypothetical protein